MRNMWNAWNAERYSNPASWRNLPLGLTNRSPTHNRVLFANPEKALTQRAQRTQTNSEEAKKDR
jgi:hypothetical protein